MGALVRGRCAGEPAGEVEQLGGLGVGRDDPGAERSDRTPRERGRERQAAGLGGERRVVLSLRLGGRALALA